MLEIRQLYKSYHGRPALNDINLSADRGKIYGFLGPNGAGKSTMMNIITGYLAASSGRVLVGGYDVDEEPEKVKSLIGYLPEQPPLYLDMTPREYLKFVYQIKKLPGKSQEAAIREVMEKTFIQDVENRLIRHLSKGYRQRVGIAQAILGKPPLIILDEPTVGLDPKQINEIRGLIECLREEHTVILSSHILSEVSAVCDQILILDQGRLIANDTGENLAKYWNRYNTYAVKVKGGAGKVKEVLAALGEEQGFLPGPVVEQEGISGFTLQSAPERDPRERLFYAMAESHLPIIQLEVKSVSLEEIFLEATSEEGKVQ
ncbi:MAG: ABC transporter ATP-binding protein [Peptococcaceae bacterium]|nr:ABC transporter ATP-binding protein [Peptococcaceae bacterium]